MKHTQRELTDLYDYYIVNIHKGLLTQSDCRATVILIRLCKFFIFVASLQPMRSQKNDTVITATLLQPLVPVASAAGMTVSPLRMLREP